MTAAEPLDLGTPAALPQHPLRAQDPVLAPWIVAAAQERPPRFPAARGRAGGLERAPREPKGRRRGAGEGTIYRRTDGLWTAVADFGWREGRRCRRYVYGKTRQEVQAKLQALLQSRKDGLLVASERLTLAAYLANWLESSRARVRPRTWSRYEQYLRIHVIPFIGSAPLAKLAAPYLQRLYAERLAAGLSATSVRHLHAVLHNALHQAERWGLVARNVVALVDPPRVCRREMQTLTPEQARQLLDAVAGERLEALYVLALATGMRQGELLGLRWRDVDLDTATLRVCTTLQRTAAGYSFGEPKTSRSRRQVHLAATAISALRRHRARQAQERLQRSPAWEDQDLVFANELGRPVDHSNLLKEFQELLRRAGLPRIRFHDLRHTAATLLLGRSVHPKVVSEMLGHSQISITLDLYSHVTPTMQRQAAQAFDEVLGAQS